MTKNSRNMDAIATGSSDLEHQSGMLTRRQLVGGMAAVGLGSLATPLIKARADSAGATEPDAITSLHQDVDLNATPSRVYEALMDEKQFSAFTGGAAEISKVVGGELKLFGGLPGIKGITGRNVELVPDARIVQAWRANGWPKGVYSIVRFELTAWGLGTRISLDQASFGPVPQKDAWDRMYWIPLKKYLEA